MGGKKGVSQILTKRKERRNMLVIGYGVRSCKKERSSMQPLRTSLEPETKRTKENQANWKVSNKSET